MAEDGMRDLPRRHHNREAKDKVINVKTMSIPQTTPDDDAPKRLAEKSPKNHGGRGSFHYGLKFPKRGVTVRHLSEEKRMGLPFLRRKEVVPAPEIGEESPKDHIPLLRPSYSLFYALAV
ncbi:hypothetical protein ACLOJK_041181 [Asimina triloba]